MAGSYEHLVGSDGGWSLIENMGDAHECVEELLWLVEYAIGRADAKRALSEIYYPQSRGEKPEGLALKYIRGQMEK